MDKEHHILNLFKKSKKLKVPSHFFKEFPEKILESTSNNTLLNRITKTPKPEVPEDFFKNFADEITIKTKSVSQVKKGKIINFKQILIATSIAAALLLVFKLNFSSDQTNIATKTTNEYSYTTEDYLSELSEDDIIDFIVEQKIDIDNEVSYDDEDLLYEELEYELDDYIYEL